MPSRKEYVTDQVGNERILWKGYPAWGQFSWLYFFSLWTVLRGSVFFYAGVQGWQLWMVGAVLLLGVAGVLRYWAQFLLTSHQVIIRNGFSGNTIGYAKHESIKVIEITQGPLAKFFRIGTVIIQYGEAKQTLRFRGIKDPEVVVAKLRALLPSSSPVFTPVS